ncbi:hypothetical protein AY601_2145 [Pedobacter cryoconitis]|uniref:Uncharacterized protein n=1 Tax=Pedobacter cryoconitis TaxID=188932 RepID=A0A127VCH7_9SPHI|nr:hypothetical protein [Pedobacter cryoconitis]AMP99046.1 hypothetical protein AY601_2145 [Pedobacter cryoconitis]
MENTADSLVERLKLIKKLNGNLWGWPNEKVQLKQAGDVLATLIADFPENTSVLINMGALQVDQGKYKEAMTFLKKAESIGSADRNLYLNIAIAMLNISAQTRADAHLWFKKAEAFQADELTIAAYFDPQGY